MLPSISTYCYVIFLVLSSGYFPFTCKRAILSYLLFVFYRNIHNHVISCVACLVCGYALTISSTFHFIESTLKSLFHLNTALNSVLYYCLPSSFLCITLRCMHESNTLRCMHESNTLRCMHESNTLR
jgi:hypothetical protein